MADDAPAVRQEQRPVEAGAERDVHRADPRAMPEAGQPAVVEPTTGAPNELLKTKTKSNQSND